jgi:anti-anti-sigma factor
MHDQHSEGQQAHPTDGGFRCEVHDGPESARVAVHGDLDLATIGEVERALRAAADAKRNVTLDLRGVSFLDSCALNLVIHIDALARSDGFNFFVVRAAPNVQRLFAMIGAEAHITFIDAPE